MPTRIPTQQAVERDALWDNGAMKKDAKQKWDDLSPAAKQVVISLAVTDVVFRAIALFDVARRPAKQVKGNKTAWALALTLLNTVGVLPLGYLLFGRHRTRR